ncbi:hypothetical protein WJX72_009758 [[Myrmecia] bisecta]|uniref:SMP-30/Gluconolactonase/LRE-like region domain-containing protein n=1 Tax=[Myrmecia] bisecta TaxID=41462 RepID=A0AAW1PT22_9CHLO
MPAPPIWYREFLVVWLCIAAARTASARRELPERALLQAPSTAPQPPSSTCTATAQAFNVLPEPFNRATFPSTENDVMGAAGANGAFGSPNCSFLVVQPEFAAILGSSSQVQILAAKDYAFAHEGAVYLPANNSVFFTSDRLGDTKTANQYVELWKVDLATGATTQLNPVGAEVPMANGATNYLGGILVISQGLGDKGSSLVAMNADGSNSRTILNNYFGLKFNSMNDVVVSRSRTLFFTDPAYGFAQGFRAAPQLGAFVWRLAPASANRQPAPPQLAADGFVRPNGLALSPDETVLYVTDTGALTGEAGAAFNPASPHTIYAFDVRDGTYLLNRRVFALTDSVIPDGLKVDAAGNVYAGTGDGVDVFSPAGTLLATTSGGSESKGKNAWDDPMHPSTWKGNHMGWLVLLGAGAASYSVLKWWAKGQQEEKQAGVLGNDARAAPDRGTARK